jgi:16S rRNA C967 or C1407 C5-methylase (RsmB/RsmF family)/NOL1/NOP2/fmu family ribosome biogenesis protein
MSVNFPQAFEARMQRSLRTEWPAFADAHRSEPPVSIRLNPRKQTAHMTGSAVPWVSHALYLAQRPVFTLDPAFHAGAYYVQEASSMLLEQVIRQCVNDITPLRVLDVCAAPGGKSTHLLSLLPDSSLLVSNEVIRSRTGMLTENIQKWGCSNVVVTQNDPQDFNRLTGCFDVIVVDAPCSGEGLFRKDAAAMQEWSEQNVLLCSQRQQRILESVWPALREGGLLIYSTCTYNDVEDEQVVKWLLTLGGKSKKIALDPAWGVTEVGDKDSFGYRCLPHRVQGEGFFISVIQKTAAQPAARIKMRQRITTPPKKLINGLALWLTDAARFEFLMHQDLIMAIPALHLDFVNFLSERLNLVLRGTAIATPTHNKLVPHHALALSVDRNPDTFVQVALTNEQALNYLRKEPLNLPVTEKGFALVTYQGLSLGWINALDNRINNLYPAGWRIRMGP